MALAALVLCLAAGAALALVLSPIATTNSNWSVSSLLDLRSPGERQAGALVASKQKRAARSAGEPDGAQQRALGKIFPPETGLPAGLSAIESIPLLSDAPLAESFEDLTGLSALPLEGVPLEGLPLAGLPPFPTELLGPGGGGIGGAGAPSPIIGSPEVPPIFQIPNNPPLVVAPPIAAVPEPQTWAMMLMGMFACGAAMRRRRKADRLVSPA